jgi:hypothetical protein
MALRRILRTAPALAIAGLLVAVGTQAAPLRPPITQAQSGKTFRLGVGETARLRLSGNWSWTQPRASSKAIQLTPVDYFADPGFSEWIVGAHASGAFTITSTGKPGCAACGLSLRRFRVTIVAGF